MNVYMNSESKRHPGPRTGREEALRESVLLRDRSKARAATSGRLESSAVLVALLLRDRLTPRPDVAEVRMGFGGAKPVLQTSLAGNMITIIASETPRRCH